MIGSIFNGMSGLLAFSKGLDTISSNVSNMNTPGYKSSELQFMDVFYRSQYSASQNGEVSTSQGGSGVGTGSTTTRFSQGEIRATGQDLDVAVDGNGFIVLRKDNETLYTRAGQFTFDDDGYLVSRANQARVLSVDGNGNLKEINQNDFSSMSQSPTTEVKFTGTLSTGAPVNSTTLNREVEITDMTVIDAAGDERNIIVKFEIPENVTTREWTVSIFEDTNLLGTGNIIYQASNQPQAGSNQVSFDLTSSNNQTTSIVINMGEPDTPNASTSTFLGTTSTLSVLDVDGFAAGSRISTIINDVGMLVTEYSNDEKEEHSQLALASFLQLQSLEQRNGGVFVANGINPVIGHADDGTMGRFIPRSVELSNVELTQQFGDLIIVQRGYQASSQVLTASNEMLQQLIEMRGRG